MRFFTLACLISVASALSIGSIGSGLLDKFNLPDGIEDNIEQLGAVLYKKLDPENKLESYIKDQMKDAIRNEVAEQLKENFPQLGDAFTSFMNRRTGRSLKEFGSKIQDLYKNIDPQVLEAIKKIVHDSIDNKLPAAAGLVDKVQEFLKNRETRGIGEFGSRVKDLVAKVDPETLEAVKKVVLEKLMEQLDSKFPAAAGFIDQVQNALKD